MIVALGLPLNVAVIILGWIFSMLLSVFIALSPISIPTPLTVALTEFFQVDTVASVHSLPVWWYLISSVWVYRCSCMQIMSILCSTTDAISSGSWPILFRVLTLNVAICIVCLHFSSFCLSLNSVADFSNTEARAPTSAGRAPCLPARRAMRFMYVVWVWVTVIFRAQFKTVHIFVSSIYIYIYRERERERGRNTFYIFSNFSRWWQWQWWWWCVQGSQCS